MRYFVSAILLTALSLLMAGCARFPTNAVPSDAPPRTLLSEITLRGRLNPDYYYFLALGVDQTRATGPVPVVTGPELTNGWGTISGLAPNQPIQQPPFFVQIHNNSFAQFRNGIYVGVPYRYEITPDGMTVRVEIDQRLLDPLLTGVTEPIVQLNWITMRSITVQIDEIGLGKEYDGFGPRGNNYLDAVPLQVTRLWVSGQDGVPDEPVYGPEETTAQTADIDISQWKVEVKIRSTATTTP